MDILHEIQKKINVPKSRTNAFGKYKYRNAEDIVDAFKKVCPEDVSLLLRDEVEHVAGRFYIKSTAILSLGEKLIATAYAYAREPESKKGMDESQITGAASSYARKYALNGLFAIDDGVDADSMDNSKIEKKKAPTEADKRKAAKKWANGFIISINASESSQDLNAIVGKNQEKISKIANYPDVAKSIQEYLEDKVASFDGV